MTILFDTLAFSRRLQTAGASEKLSDELASAINDLAMSNVATKADLREAVHSMTVRMGVAVVAASTLIIAVLSAVISLK